jgi:hypothetical protein
VCWWYLGVECPAFVQKGTYRLTCRETYPASRSKEAKSTE